MLNKEFQDCILKATGAQSLREGEVIQSLWSGYGKIQRISLEGSAWDSVIIKHVKLPEQSRHPRGWNTDLSHQRKLRSYEVESYFYQNYSAQCPSDARLPGCLAVKQVQEETLLVLEDLDAAGYAGRRSGLHQNELESCLSWLAHFHATFLHQKPAGLWPVGTYWHLETRPDELEELQDLALKQAAPQIDAWLNQSPFLTFVHGDSKVANFCFGDQGQVAALDFQYVGGGCGMKDVAYFIGSVLYEDDCERYEQPLLDFYFQALKKALEKQNKALNFTALEKNWRELYPVAWTDFHRFLKGWSPGHWKINSYSERLTRQILNKLQHEA